MVALEVDDPAAAEFFCQRVFGLEDRVRFRPARAASSGFRGFTLSVLVSRPASVDAFVDEAEAAGATVLKPAAKSLWGYGGAVQAPDGTVWTLASSSKKDSGPASREIDDLVLQLGVDDVAASKDFYVERGFEVGSSFGRRYADFALPGSPVTLALLKRKALAKSAGVDPTGEGSHRVVVISDRGDFTDPDGFVWEGAPSA